MTEHALPTLAPRSAAQAELVERSTRLIPGGTTNSAVMPAGQEILVERGAGPYLYDVDDRRFVDFVLGGGPLVLGHAHPRLTAAIQRASEYGTQHYALHRRAVELAERLTRYVPSAEAVRFTASGSEATLHALRLARAVTGRSAIVKFDGAYHGHHDLAVWSFEHSPTEPPHPYPESAGVQHGVAEDLVVLPFNDIDAVRDLFAREGRRLAAVICEPLQRYLPPRPGFLQALRKACDDHGAVLIFDEVVTGFRLAPGGAQERYGVFPDLTALGKALAGGVPFAALVGKAALMSHLDPASPPATRSFHCGTFNGHLLGVECAHATLDVLIAEGGIKRLEALTQEVQEALERACAASPVPAQVIAEGGLFQTVFAEGPVFSAADARRADPAISAAYHRLLLEAGIYKLPAKGYLSVVHGSAEIEELADVTRWALRRLAGA